MAQKLWAVGNATPFAASLTSTEHPGDDTPVVATNVTHTGGKDDNFIKIPDCSDQTYYAQHHLLIKSANWTVAIWSNDDAGHILCWSPGDYYSTQTIPGSSDYQNCTVMITEGSSGPVVTCAPW